MRPWAKGGLAAVCLGLGCSATAADRVRIVEEGGLRAEWRLAEDVPLAVPSYPAVFAERGDSVCVAIGYAVNPDGTTSDFSLLKGWSNSTGDREPVPGFWEAFAKAGASAVSQWKFAPRPEVGKPQRSYTVATLHFMGREAMDAAALRGHCAIPDLAGLIQKLKSKGYQTGDLAKSEFERYRRMQQSRQPPLARPNFPARR